MLTADRPVETVVAPPPAAPSGNGVTTLLAAAASVAAGLVHAAAAGSHSGDRSLALLFAATAVLQLGAGGLATFAGRRWVGATVAVNAIAFGAWGLSRATGLPVIESLREAQEVGWQDGIAAAFAATAVVAGVAALGGLGTAFAARPPVVALVATAALGLAVPGMVTDHSHGEHSDEVVTAAAAGHGHTGTKADTATPTPTPTTAVPTGPIISLTDPRVTKEQRANAQRLIDVTAAAMKKFPDEQSLLAAGYRSINDSITGFEHFVQWGYLADGQELNPERIESIVMKMPTAPGEKKIVASAMYILERGKTMADVPEIGGALTTWHDHQNLCWDSAGHVVGLLRNGQCVPAGTFAPTPPMLHVWMVEHECGPFAGLEGSHGAGCGHDDHA